MDTEPRPSSPGDGSEVPSQTGQSPQPTQTTVELPVSIRRIPKYPRFIILGAGIGAIVTFILTASFPSDKAIGFGALLGYFLIYGVPAGIVLGALLAIGLDLTWRKRARVAIAAHTTVDPLPYDDDSQPGESPVAEPSATEPSATEPSAAAPAAEPAAELSAEHEPPKTP